MRSIVMNGITADPSGDEEWVRLIIALKTRI